MRLALYQPDIPQNTGTLVRLCACLDVPLDIIEPCGFTFTDKQLRRAAMDYAERAELTRHNSWADFIPGLTGRLILATTKGARPHTDFAFRADDIILLGQEQSGVPNEVHDRADARLVIPMRGGARSLNIAVAGAMILGEALRQTDGFATETTKLMGEF
ncbi:MAG: tRNA (cytidine(34)-2'-O)-methyltransferase [Alphaproteobacteria bacterium]|jgi:tRNA (cytidine/uridine-2'-O-)-methyltransferase|nr:tRNA methyltransferase [Rhodospirillaceae bacterium]MDP6020297.1 tRNA (cytidine(34)-2'-O)-methyltransferase [Alphaproteobacteria bacterium]MDP6256574.1 tRNA (cytidine(34)-2'-O)-methyltransferase [Alphaproteobacteria bacterium]MDP7055555.1 tRNA (cytidine(34)-2'-O)-methyltransferase [Alphaproteobacteria bacterium]MDP7229419.1 tRNA (cytidine(34)-2'-O)-methyltransferase [Alphaproteobacteria bacterium]|tara:strand:- start:13496 stop:13972 length:477 start_codon:yes stop_codon:yes gene_type:complete